MSFRRRPVTSSSRRSVATAVVAARDAELLRSSSAALLLAAALEGEEFIAPPGARPVVLRAARVLQRSSQPLASARYSWLLERAKTSLLDHRQDSASSRRRVRRRPPMRSLSRRTWRIAAQRWSALSACVCLRPGIVVVGKPVVLTLLLFLVVGRPRRAPPRRLAHEPPRPGGALHSRVRRIVRRLAAVVGRRHHAGVRLLRSTLAPQLTKLAVWACGPRASGPTARLFGSIVERVVVGPTASSDRVVTISHRARRGYRGLPNFGAALNKSELITQSIGTGTMADARRTWRLAALSLHVGIQVLQGANFSTTGRRRS